MSGFPRSGLPLLDGVLQMTSSLNATDPVKIGWRGATQMYKIDSPGAVPSTAILHAGVAYSPDGGMYTTTAVPTATSVRAKGYVVRADGAMHIDTVVSGQNYLGQKKNANGVWITT